VDNDGDLLLMEIFKLFVQFVDGTFEVEIRAVVVGFEFRLRAGSVASSGWLVNLKCAIVQLWCLGKRQDQVRDWNR
jgi:hypothetical protein